jgi:putative flippase GtrA
MRPDNGGNPARGAGVLFRFVIVGVASAVAYSLLAAAVVRLDLAPAYVSGLILFGLFIPATFQAHKRFTFRATRLMRSAFAGYAMLQIACYSLVSLASTHLLTGTYALDAALYFATVGAAAAASFLIGKLFIFRPAR